ncbi:MAG: T9SS type A sorting domain-containing protein [Bacteroidales bacterium]|jgi:hypothetical protein|nr:T9SS type A sorting domain-containing protein [Bacteroidales bacterium]
MKRTLFLVFSLTLSTYVYSAGFTSLGAYFTGSGTLASPYEIWSARDLDTLSWWVRYGNDPKYTCTGKYFKLMADIDMSITTGTDQKGNTYNRSSRANNFIPIGARKETTSSISVNIAYYFAGIFDGDNHIISNLKTTVMSNNYVGLFGHTGGSSTTAIKNVYLTGINIQGEEVIGGLIAIADSTTIENCYVSGIISAKSSIGGLIGKSVGSQINKCITDVNISNNSSPAPNIGGFIGYTNDISTTTIITNSRSKGSITSSFTAYIYTGGFIGKNESPSLFIYNCYSTTEIISIPTNNNIAHTIACFLVNTNTVTLRNCYAAGTITKSRIESGGNQVKFSGFVYNEGSCTSNITNCYYNRDWQQGNANVWDTNCLYNINAGAAIDKSLTEISLESFVTALNNATSNNDTYGNVENPFVYEGNRWKFPYGFPRLWYEPAPVLPPKVIIGSSDTVSFYRRTSPLVIPADFTGDTPDTIILCKDAKLTDSSTSTDYFLINLGGIYKATNNNTPQEYLHATWLSGGDRWNFVGSPIGDTNCIFFSTDENLPYMNAVSFDEAPVSPLPNEFWLGVQADITPFPLTPQPQEIGIFLWDYTANSWNITAHKTSPIRKGEGLFAMNITDTINYANNVDAVMFWHKVRTATEASICNTDFDFDISNDSSVFYNETNGDSVGYWFALSNPYTFPIKAKAFLQANSNKIQGNCLYLWNVSENHWDLIDADSIPNQTIASMQGFMVAANNTPGSEDFHPTKFTFSTSPDSVSESKDCSNEAGVTLFATANNITKTALIKFDSEANNSFDLLDAYVLFGQNMQEADPYFQVDKNRLKINVIKDLPYVVGLNIHSYQPADIDLAFTNSVDGVSVWLIDLSDGSTHSMDSNNVYTTFINEGMNTDRFVVKLDSTTNSLNHLTVNDLNLWICNRRITAEGQDLLSLEVFNLLGQPVFYTKIHGNTYTTTLSLSSGSYVAKVNSKHGSKTIPINILM